MGNPVYKIPTLRGALISALFTDVLRLGNPCTRASCLLKRAETVNFQARMKHERLLGEEEEGEKKIKRLTLGVYCSHSANDKYLRWGF